MEEKLRDSEKTFRWITGILNRRGIPFVISGGLAAKSYGSPRPLNDIDIDVHDPDVAAIADEVKPYIIKSPGRYIDERWDCVLMTLNHEGQEIDICGGDTVRICDARTGEWVESPTNFDHTETRELFGVPVSVVSRQDLIAYKSMLAGDHQQVDIRAAQNI
jgi:hypothetical protein